MPPGPIFISLPEVVAMGRVLYQVLRVFPHSGILKHYLK